MHFGGDFAMFHSTRWRRHASNKMQENMSSSSIKSLEVIKSYLNAIEQLDADLVLALFTDETVINTPMMPEGLPTRLQGLAALRPTYGHFLAGFSQYQWIDPQFNATDDVELSVVRCSSRGLLKNGREYANDYCIFVRARDGKIVEATEYFNPIKAARAFAP